MQNTKKHIIFLTILVIGVLSLSFIAYSELNINAKPWSVIHFSTGQVYIGKISNLPNLRLYSAYSVDLVENLENPEESSFKLIPVRETIWAPEFLELNSSEVIFHGKLTEESASYQAIEEAENER